MHSPMGKLPNTEHVVGGRVMVEVGDIKVTSERQHEVGFGVTLPSNLYLLWYSGGRAP